MIKEIEDFEGLEALRLEGNTVGVEAARVIAKALEKKSELKVSEVCRVSSFPACHSPPRPCVGDFTLPAALPAATWSTSTKFFAAVSRPECNWERRKWAG